jgi:hypothetical protein
MDQLSRDEPNSSGSQWAHKFLENDAVYPTDIFGGASFAKQSSQSLRNIIAVTKDILAPNGWEASERRWP